MMLTHESLRLSINKVWAASEFQTEALVWALLLFEESLLLVGTLANIRLWHESECLCGNLRHASDTCQHSLWHGSERPCVNTRLLFMEIGLWQLLCECTFATHGHELHCVVHQALKLQKSIYASLWHCVFACLATIQAPGQAYHVNSRLESGLGIGQLKKRVYVCNAVSEAHAGMCACNDGMNPCAQRHNWNTSVCFSSCTSIGLGLFEVFL